MKRPQKRWHSRHQKCQSPSESSDKSSPLHWMDDSWNVHVIFSCLFALQFQSFQLHPGRRHRGTACSFISPWFCPGWWLLLLQLCLASFAKSIASPCQVLLKVSVFCKSDMKSSKWLFCGLQSSLNHLFFPHWVSYQPPNSLLFHRGFCIQVWPHRDLWLRRWQRFGCSTENVSNSN